MALTLVTAPTSEPVTVDELKVHLRVGDDETTEDGLIASLGEAARAYVETFTGRALMTQTWDLKLDGFPCGDVLDLPTAPIASITSITYTDTAGASQTWSSSNYLTDLPSGPFARPGRITPVYGVSWPSTRDVMNAVAVRYVAGYTSAVLVPEALKAAIKLMAAQWYAQREPVVVGSIAQNIPLTVESLLWPYRVFARAI